MLLQLFEGLSFPLLWLALAAVGVGWYLLICGGLYLFLHRSRYAEKARRYKTQVQATRAGSGARRDPRRRALDVDGDGEHRDRLLVLVPRLQPALCEALTDYPLWYIPISIFGVFLVMEVFEWTFHWACHRNSLLWKVHKHHHRYANPTPFGVMADAADRHVHQVVADPLDPASCSRSGTSP